MGSSSSSNSSCNKIDENLHEKFTFQFTDCSCQCNAKKIYSTDNNLPSTTFLTVLMSKMNRTQYDLECDCHCGEDVKIGFLFGNTSSSS